MRQLIASLVDLSISHFIFAQTQKVPNVVIIYFNDMGYSDLEPYGMTGGGTVAVEKYRE